MKLSITQTVLGILLVLASCFIVGWMTYEAPDYLRQPASGESIHVDVVPKHETMFNVSRYGAYSLPVFGILLIIVSAIQIIRPDTRTQKLAAVTIAAGVLTGLTAFIITTYGFPTSFYSTEPNAENLMLHTFINPGRTFIFTQSIAGFTSLGSLAIIGCGIAQLVKTRKTQTY